MPFATHEACDWECQGAKVLKNELRTMMMRIILWGCCLFYWLPVAYAQHENITLQLKWKHQFQFAGYYMALEKGFYDDVGLDVHLIEKSYANKDSQNLLRHEGVYCIRSSGALIDYANGQPIQAIAAIFQHSPMVLMVLKSSHINKLGDLRGKRISLSSDFEQVEVLADLEKHHLQADDYIHGVIWDIQELIQHHTDAIPVYMTHEPKILQEQGIAYRLFKPKDDGIDFYGDVLVTSQQEIMNHGERVEKFLQATKKGWMYALNHVDESIDVVLKKYNSQHLSREQLRFEANMLHDFIMPDLVPIGYMNPERWQDIAQTYVSLGFMPDGMDLSHFIYQPKHTLYDWLRAHAWRIITFTLLGLLCLALLIAWKHRREGLQRIAQLELIEKNQIKTEIMQLELTEKNQQLEKALQDAEQATQAKGQFLATMSHEIRTPLNGILGLTELVLNSELTPQQRNHLHTVQASGEALLSVLNDILDFSKIEAGLMEMKASEFNPNRLIEHVVKLFSSRVAEHSSVELICDGIPLLPHCPIGDVEHLHQILVNLLSNAVKFTEYGEIIVSVQKRSESKHHLLLRFQVSDTGSGILKADQVRLFDAFTQADSSHQRQHGGTGLGLSIVKRLVELMGSQIHLESELGKGSRFFFDIRLEKSEQANVDDAYDYLEHFHGWHALLIDEQGGHRNVLEHTLQSWGMHCQTYTAHQVVQEKNIHHAYDIVFVTQDCMDSHPDIPPMLQAMQSKIMMMIESNIQVDDDFRERYTFDAFMRKPIFTHSLCETLLSVMNIKERHIKIEAPAHRVKRNESILLAEDNPVNQEVFLGMLEHQGFHHIDVVGNGLEAVEAFEKGRYDLILMDVQMPRMDGLHACREIRHLEASESLKHTPILALTAHALEENKQQSLQAGMDDHLTKPLTGKRLQQALEHWLPIDASIDESLESAPLNQTPNSPEPTKNETERAVIDREALCQLRQDIGFGIGMILDSYMQSLPEQMATMQQAIEDKDTDALRRCGHKLKGGSLSVAAMRLGELGSRIETMGEAGDIEGIAKQMKELESEMQAVVDALHAPWVDELR